MFKVSLNYDKGEVRSVTFGHAEFESVITQACNMASMLNFSELEVPGELVRVIAPWIKSGGSASVTGKEEYEVLANHVIIFDSVLHGLLTLFQYVIKDRASSSIADFITGMSVPTTMAALMEFAALLDRARFINIRHVGDSIPPRIIIKRIEG